MSIKSLNSFSDSSLNRSSDDESGSPKRFYGWRKETSDDEQDIKLINKAFFKNPTLINFPPKLELLDMPPVYEQGQIGSCTANAISNLYRYGKQTCKKKSLSNSRRVDYLSTIINEF
jgi:hypothetical protein